MLPIIPDSSTGDASRGVPSDSSQRRHSASRSFRLVITIGTSLESSMRAVELAHRFPNVFATIGVHPNEAAKALPEVIGSLRELARSPRVVAIGEIGLDYHRMPRPDGNTAWEMAGDQFQIESIRRGGRLAATIAAPRCRSVAAPG